VLAAASLTDSFTALEKKFEADHPGVDVKISFAGSSALVQQITNGAPADVFASADEKNMQKLVDAGLVESPVIFARNTLEIAVARGNPKHVRGLADLDRSDLVVVLADPAVPVGTYAQRILTKAGLTVHAKSLELDVKSALARVTTGEADATIVYVSDIDAAGRSASGVPIPAADNVIARYPIAVVKASKNTRAARAFLAALRSARGQRILRAHGFLGADSLGR
jgi:molybdate transport system substrate-binding protein